MITATGVEDRPIHLAAAAMIVWTTPSRSASGQRASINVLDHHHRAVDEDAEVDRADRQQIRRNAAQVETDEREQQRERDRDGDDEPDLKSYRKKMRMITTSTMPRSRLS
jgi:hypothetical protein